MPINVPLWSPTLGDVPPSLLNEAFSGSQIITTNISTVGAATIPAAAIAGTQIARTGVQTGAFTDTTDTAANIVTANGPFVLNDTFVVTIKNLTLFQETIAGGTGVTVGGTTIIPPFSAASWVFTVGGTSASPTISMAHVGTVSAHIGMNTSNPQATTLTTVGAGTILAASFNAGVVLRTGSTTAFTDTTDTVANLIAGIAAWAGNSSTVLGQSAYFTYVNNTVAAATIQGASSVTVTGGTLVPANSWATYLVTLATATTVTMQCVAQGFFPTSGTVTANAATPVVVSTAAVTAGSNIILTYASGSVGATGAFVSAKTAGTSFSIKSVTSDTAVYNWTILG